MKMETTYDLLNSQLVAETALDYLRVLDDAIEDGVIQGRFSLDLELIVEPEAYLKNGRWKKDDETVFWTKMNNPVRNRRHARDFIRAKLNYLAYSYPRQFRSIVVFAKDRLTGATFAAKSR
ncbi:hypothetical protein ACJU26_08995 [Acidithiobacillus sp. M4-SHS-6]|uniref:hypothetical protein n=1 Tax=Acidithiobacillus sp. M4-SHS-6 TaxID=3383024 RepID=UPI0039BDD2FD